jgi:myo-inositol-1(or 4)-monophosphatase
MKDLTPFIESVLRESGELIFSHYGSVQKTTQKADPSQIVTEVDIASEKLLISRIQEKFPDHSVIAEESGYTDKKSDYTWIIDPIDGTSNFANGLPWFGVMIALLYKADPIAGGIYLPVTDELYTAEKGKGAYRNGGKYVVRKEVALKNCLIALHFDPANDKRQSEIIKSVFAHLIPRIRNMRTTNSVVDYAYVTEGKIAGLINFKNKIWDDVAVTIIAQEAGCVVTDHAGNPPDFSFSTESYTRDFSFIIAFPEIHRQLLKLVIENSS